MLAAGSRVVKPKLSLSISTTVNQSTRPSLSLMTPSTAPRTPISPSPISPTARNTRMNSKGFSTFQQPTYSYVNSSSTKSILKKSSKGSTGSPSKKLQIDAEPIVYCVTPIEAGEEYYGGYTKMSKEERRWMKRSYE